MLRSLLGRLVGRDDDEALARGVRHHEQGELQAAEQAYRKVMARSPDHGRAVHLLGILLGNQGRTGEATEHLARAGGLAGGGAAALVDLGNLHRRGGQVDAALEVYRGATVADPKHVEAHRRLAHALADLERYEEAARALEQVLQREPESVADHQLMANLLGRLGRAQSALTHFEAMARLQPPSADGMHALGLARLTAGQPEAAADAFLEVIRRRPSDYAAHNNLGLALHYQRRAAEAIPHFQRALELSPGFTGAYVNLGGALRDGHRLGKARSAFESALARSPDDADALNNLGSVLTDLGEIEPALDCFRRALEQRGDFLHAQSNHLLTLQYSTDIDPGVLYEAHRRWGQAFAAPTTTRHSNPPDPGRPLSIGYLSGDLSTHPGGLFLAPVLEAHDTGRYPVTCYSTVVAPDAVTARIESSSQRWRNVVGLSDAQLHDLIVDDGIDILIDLAGHSASGRLAVFARKPAPVQATWIGYLHSIGLDAMDYLIADAVAVPEEATQPFTEQVLRLPGGYLCYGQPQDTPEVAPAPAREGDCVTFGSFNNLAKLNDAVIDLWARVLAECEGSRLVLKNQAFSDAGVCGGTLARFERRAIDASRIELEPHSPRSEYFAAFARIDIALDPFPFSGGTVSCDACWMGVPVVTLPGDRMASRTTASILSGLDLEDLIATDATDFVRIACGLAADRDRLEALRREMRERFARSTLGDADAFCRRLESGLREVWVRWCEGR